MFKKVIGCFLFILSIFLLVACDDGTNVIPNAAERVAAVKAQLTLVESAYTDLDLPTSIDGVSISWASSNEEVISNKGVVVPQEMNCEVTLTATLTLGSVTDTKEFIVVVKNGHTTIEAVRKSLELLFSAPISTDLYLPTFLDGVSISWASEKEDILSNSGVILKRFVVDAEVKLEAILTSGIVTRGTYFLINVLRKEDGLIPTEWGEIVSNSELDELIDATVSEFLKNSPNAQFYYGRSFHIEDVENNIWFIGDPAFFYFSCTTNIIRWEYHFYTFENGTFYMYIWDYYWKEYTKINCGKIQENKSLYNHIVDNASEEESSFRMLIAMLLDIKGNFTVYKSEDNTYRFLTKKTDGFSFWDLYDFEWELDNHIYSISSLVCQIKIDNGMIKDLAFTSSSKMVKSNFVMSFTYGNIVVGLPIIK